MSSVAFFAALAASTISHTLPFARTSLGLTEGNMFAIFGITRASSLLGIGFAIYADREGRRQPFTAAYGLVLIGNLVTAILPGPVLFTLGQSITRIGVVAVAAIAVVILAEELPAKIRAYGISVYALAGALGSGFGLLLLPLAERTDSSWRMLFGVSVIGVVLVPLLNRFLCESRAFIKYEKPVTFRRALQTGLSRHFWPMAGVAFFVAAYSAPAFDFVFERLIDDLQWGASPARLLLFVFSGLGSLGLLVGGRMADSAGRKQTTVLALAIGASGGIGFYTFTSGWLLAPSILVATFGTSLLIPAFAAHRSELFPTRIRATAAGWITNAAILGSIAGFAVGAAVADTFGLSETITMLAIGLVFAALLMTLLPETRGADLVRRPKQARADPTIHHGTSPT